MSVVLNEFSLDELQEMLTCIEAKLSDLNYKSYELNHRLHEQSRIRQELNAEYSRLYDIFMTWQVQVTNARDEVATRDIIKSN